MRRVETGDSVRVDIPDQSDPDYERFHGRYGEVVDVLEDDVGRETGDQRDSHLFTVEFEDGSTHGFRWRDLRPAPEG
jgi:ribosomal protein L21E